MSVLKDHIKLTLFFLGVFLLSIWIYSNEIKKEERNRFIDFHVLIIQEIIQEIDNKMNSKELKENQDFNSEICNYVLEMPIWEEIENSLIEKNYVCKLGFMINPPQICGKSLAYNDYFLQYANGNLRLSSFDDLFNYKINEHIELEIRVSNYERKHPLYSTSYGYVHIDTYFDHKVQDDFLYKGKYSIDSRFLIPRDIKKWQKKVRPEILEIFPQINTMKVARIKRN